MIKTTTFGIAGLALALAAYAAPASATPVPASCSSITTVGGFAAAGSCSSGDKLFTYGDTDLSAGVGMAFVVGGGGLTNIVFQSFGAQGVNGPFTGFFEYDIEVTDPNFVIKGVTVDSNLGQVTTGSEVTKEIYIDGVLKDTITSVDGDPETSIYLAATALTIKEYISIASGEVLFTITNAFSQQAVPVPGMLGLMGLGLVGMGLAARRRKA